jgi:predicted Rossmann-fold nucleotide-binding protein
MSAASRGAAEAGGRVVGVTCEDIEAWRSVRPNPWVGEEIRIPRLRDRLARLVEIGHALAAFPGGVGTLSEVAFTWSMLQTGPLSPRPLVLVGEAWREVLYAFLQRAGPYLGPDDAGRLLFESDGLSAAETVLRHLSRMPPIH